MMGEETETVQGGSQVRAIILMGDTWKIPRPSLTHSDVGSRASTATRNYHVNITNAFQTGQQTSKEGEVHITMSPGSEAVQQWVDKQQWTNTASRSSVSSSTSHSASSGSLLLESSDTRHHSIKPADTQSVASSTHFTVVNGVSSDKQQLASYCRLHQVPILVISMTGVLFLTILAIVLYVQMRSRVTTDFY